MENIRYLNVKMDGEFFDRYESKIKICSELIKKKGFKTDKSSIVKMMIEMFIENPSRFLGAVKNEKGQLV